MAVVTKNYRDGVLKLQDGTEYTPNEITIPFVNATLTWSEKKEAIQIKDRGALSHLRASDEMAIEGSFTCKFQEFISDTHSAVSPTAYEAFRQTGEAAAWESTNDDCGDVYTLTMILEIENVCSTGDHERITFSKVYVQDISWSDGEDPASEITFNFTSFATAPTITKYS